MRILLAHDWLCGYRGGEAVLDAIARAVTPEHEIAALLVMVADGSPHTPTLDRLPSRPSVLQRVPGAAGRLRRWMMPLYPVAVRDLSRRVARMHRETPIDLVISTSSAAIKSLAPPSGVPHLCYCHSPARYVWSQTDEYARGRAGPLRAAGLRLAGGVYRNWDRRTAAHVTRFLANSTHTAELIRHAYGREAEVLFPPTRTDFFTPATTAPGPDAPWLVVGAMEPYKRADLAIEAARATGHSLVICGTGSQRGHLQHSAPPNVTFTGRVSDDVLRAHYRSARLLLFPQIEDFGIVAVEAQAAGCPVVARRAGGALETVIDGTSGTLFDEPTVDAVLDAIGRVPDDARDDCRANASRFSEEIFERRILEEIDRAVNRPSTSDHGRP